MQLPRFLSSLAVVLALGAALTATPATAAVRAEGPSLTAPTLSTVTSSRVAFRWTPRAHARRYELRVSRGSAFSGSETHGVTVPRATLLLARGTWFAKVRSWAPGGSWSSWGRVLRVRVLPRRDLMPPSRPAALHVVRAEPTGVALAFGRSRDESGVKRYEIYANGHRVATTTSTTPHVTGLACATAYTFTARAVDPAGNRSPASPPARARTRSCKDPSAPSVPGALEATSVTEVAVALRWAASTDPEGNLAGYVVTRDGVELGRPVKPEFIATPLAAQRTYVFGVRSRDRSGNLSAETTLSVQTGSPVQSTGLVHAFLLASDGESFRDFQAHYTGIGWVYPTYFDVRADATLQGADQPHVTRFAQQRGIKVLPRVQTQQPAVIQAVLSDPALRARLLQNIVAQSAAAGYDGVNIDFEAGDPALRPIFTQFITELTAAMHAQGDLVSVAIGATTRFQTTGRAGFYDYAAISAVADESFVMAWNEHWATSPAGPLASIGWLTRVLSWVESHGRNAKFTIGAQLYGFDWPQGQRGTPIEFNGMEALRARVGAVQGYDAVAHEPTFTYTAGGVPHTVYYANGSSISERLGWYRSKGFGMGVWRLGREDSSLWASPVVLP